MARKIGESISQPVVVERRPRANGLVGADAVAKAVPDGYTMLLTDRGALGINLSLYRKIPYDPLKDFAYIGIVTMAPYVLSLDPKLGACSLSELVSLAKAKPGAIDYANFGIASMAHLNIEAQALSPARCIDCGGQRRSSQGFALPRLVSLTRFCTFCTVFLWSRGRYARKALKRHASGSQR